MQIVDLFSGIGGFSLAGKWMGWTTVQLCEIDPFCGQVLNKNFPGVPLHPDIKTLSGDTIKANGHYSPNLPTILVGGFPCQPYSLAGKREGGEDDRALWPQMLRLVRELAPDWIVGENVGGLLNQDGGLALEQMLVDLEAENYTVWPYLLPACGVNAPHRRDRLWIVAHANRQERFGRSGAAQRERATNGRERAGMERATARYGEVGTTPHACSGGGSTVNYLQSGESHADRGATPHANGDGQQQPEGLISEIGGWSGYGGKGSDAHANGSGCQERHAPALPGRAGYRTRLHAEDATHPERIGCQDRLSGPESESQRPSGQCRNGSPEQTDWSAWPTQPPLCDGNDGVSPGLVRPARIRAYVRWRNQAIKAGGNAVVPKLVYQIFQAIEQTELTL